MNKLIQRLLMWGGFVVVVGGVLFLVMSVINNPVGENGAASALTKPVTDQDWIKGNKDAKLELVEYADFQCPACRTYYGVLAQLKNDLGADTMRVVFRHFPLSSIHRNAKAGAYAAEAAGRQGKFWEMHDLLFEGQADWANSGKPQEIFVQYAVRLALDTKRFEVDMKSDEIKNKVDQQYDDAVAMDVNSTPTFFLNGKRLPSARSFEEFKSFLANELKAVNSQ